MCIRDRSYPQFNFSKNEIGYFEPGAGYLFPEKCIDVQLKLAKNNGAAIILNQEVLDISDSSSGVLVKIKDRTILAENVIVCAGAWVSNFIPKEVKEYLKIYRQVLYWFEPKGDSQSFLPSKFPVYIRIGKTLEDTFYGFPAIDGSSGGIKLALEQYTSTCTPDTLNKTVTTQEVDEVFQNISPFLNIKNSCVKSLSCMYTVTPDSHFVIDKHPESENKL